MHLPVLHTHGACGTQDGVDRTRLSGADTWRAVLGNALLADSPKPTNPTSKHIAPQPPRQGPDHGSESATTPKNPFVASIPASVYSPGHPSRSISPIWCNHVPNGGIEADCGGNG
jgi:hypothetical protein